MEKEHGIIFSDEMVTAILAGRKTQTRRVMKPQPEFLTGSGRRVYHDADFKKSWEHIKGTGEGSGFSDCPFGTPGETLYVKENYYAYGFWDIVEGGYTKDGSNKRVFIDYSGPGLDFPYRYKENPPVRIRKNTDREIGWHKRNSLYMPRVASRLRIEVTDLRAERLQDITEEDAIQEGITHLFTEEEMEANPRLLLSRDSWTNYLWHGDHWNPSKYVSEWEYQYSGYKSAKDSYLSLFARINGPAAVKENPFVWVRNFKVI